MVRESRIKAVGGGLLTVVVLNFLPGLTLISPLLGSVVAGYLYARSSTDVSAQQTKHRVGLLVVAVILLPALLIPPIANPELFPATVPPIAVAKAINGGIVHVGYPDTYVGFTLIYVAVTSLIFTIYGFVGSKFGSNLSQFGPLQAEGHM